MAAKTYNNIVDSRFFAVKETTFGTQVDHAGSDVVPHKPGAALKYEEGEAELEECKGTHGLSDVIRLPQKNVSWSLPECYLKASDSSSNEPDFAEILESLFGSQLDADGSGDTTTATTHTTTSITVTTAASWSVGAIVRAAGDVTSAIEDDIAFVTAISGSVVTLAPALSSAPGAAGGDTFYFGWSWKLDKDGAVSFTGAHELSNSIKIATGCIAQNGSLKFSRNDSVMISADGVGCGTYVVGGTSELDAGINNSVTSMDVPTGQGYRFSIPSGTSVFLTIEAEGVNTEETVEATAISGDTLTIVRGAKSTSPSAHGAGAVIKPWSPTLTKYGSPLPSTVAEFKVSGVAYGMHDLGVAIANGRTLREDEYGAGGISDGIIPGENNSQKVNLTINGKFKASTLGMWGTAQQEENITLWGKTGNTDFGRICFYVPKARMKIPEIPEGAPEAMLSIECQALETSGDDEVYFGIV